MKNQKILKIAKIAFVGLLIFLYIYLYLLMVLKLILPQPPAVQEEPITKSFPKEVVSKTVKLDMKPLVEEIEVIKPTFNPIDCALDADTQEYLYGLCEENDLDFTLMLAVIRKESNFDASAISPTNDYGLMQINQVNHTNLSNILGITDFLDAKQNIRAGVYMFKTLFDKYGDTAQVLMAYNMGEGGASKKWSAGIYSTSYVEKVLQYQEEMR